MKCDIDLQKEKKNRLFLFTYYIPIFSITYNLYNNIQHHDTVAVLFVGICILNIISFDKNVYI